MSRAKFGPAAGTPQGPEPLPATFFPPQFARLNDEELRTLLHAERDSNLLHVYLLLRTGCDFTSGHMLTTYARLIELMTPPQPERGRRREGPTYKQLRTALDTLEAHDMIRRDLGSNAAQGQLRLYVTVFLKRATQEQKRRA